MDTQTTDSLVSEEPTTQLLDCRATCEFLGGSRPIDPATLYRGIRAGRYPKPLKIGERCARWLRSELEAVIAARIAERDVEAA